MTEEGVQATWQRLINPEMGISPAITALTGIRQAMVKGEDAFHAIAVELLQVLQGQVLVAHNVRFVYGFLKNAFKACGLPFKPPLLCSMKLTKWLYPDLKHYDLAFLSKMFSGVPLPMHRVHADALASILEKMIAHRGKDKVLDCARMLLKNRSIPLQLITDIHELPDSPGVYLFYGKDNAFPLYIGKSVRLRQRVLSHFQADYAHPKEFALAQQVVRVDIIPTAGELSALLLESQLIKEKMPIYNRRLRRTKEITSFQCHEKEGYRTITIVRTSVLEGDEPAELYGAFRSLAAAKKKLLELVKKHHLCMKLCQLEAAKNACFSYQLKRCFGACVNEEPYEVYNQRLIDALTEFIKKEWPYAGAIAIYESCPINQRTQYQLFNQWRYLGALTCEDELLHWKQLAGTSGSYQYDEYKILRQYLNNTDEKQVIELVD